MADCNYELHNYNETMFMIHMWIKLNYIPVLNVLLVTDSLDLQNICILKKTSLKGA